jgi:hypothetical protein
MSALDTGRRSLETSVLGPGNGRLRRLRVVERSAAGVGFSTTGVIGAPLARSTFSGAPVRRNS